MSNDTRKMAMAFYFVSVDEQGQQWVEITCATRDWDENTSYALQAGLEFKSQLHDFISELSEEFNLDIIATERHPQHVLH